MTSNDDAFPGPENRREDRGIVQMGPGHIRVVEIEYIARLKHLPAELLGELDLVRGYTDCFGHALALRGAVDVMLDAAQKNQI